MKEAYEHWKSEANQAVEKALEHQLWGKGWEKRIEKGGMPEWIVGAILGHQRGSPYNQYRNHFDNEIDVFGGWLMKGLKGNMGAMRHLEAIARAYHGEWSDYYHDEEILHRVVAAMDFYWRAQGKNGGFLGPSLPGRNVNWPKWIGGPERGKGHHGLEVGQQNLYRAFSMLRKEIDKRGLLDASIDHDLNPDTPEVPRREAYAEMAKRSYKRMSRQVIGRSVANQSLHNFAATYRIYQLLKTTSPEWAEQEKERIIRLAEITSGVRRNPKTHHYHFSPKGLSNENGYAGDYGSGNPGNLAHIAKMSDLQVLKRQLPKAFEAYSHFLYPGNNPDGYRTLKKVEWISSRPYKGFPGTKCYLRNLYAARELKIPGALRHYELYDKHNLGRKGGRSDTLRKTFRPHGDCSAGCGKQSVRSSRPWVEKGGKVGSAVNRLPPAVRATGRHCVCRRVSKCRAVRHGDATLFFECGGKNNVKLRYRTPEYDRLAFVKYEDKGPKMPAKFAHGKVLKTFRYGPYFIVMNASEEESFTYQVPEDMRDKQAIELLTGREEPLDRRAELAPASSRAFVIKKK